MAKGPFKMAGYSYPGSSMARDTTKTTQKERDAMTPAQRLLAVVPNEEAYNKLSDADKKAFNKAAKKANIPMKPVTTKKTT